MLKGEDIVVLLKLTHVAPEWSVRTLENETTIPKSVVQRSLKRLGEAGLFDHRRRVANVSQAEEFLIHGLKYVFPGAVAGESRGFATAWAARPLVDRLAAAPTDVAPVWPSAHGDTRGLALEPLHPSLGAAAKTAGVPESTLAFVELQRAATGGVDGHDRDDQRLQPLQRRDPPARGRVHRPDRALADFAG